MKILKQLPLRKGVGIVLLNYKNDIFVGKRIDNPKKFWQMPQGGVEKDESFVKAAKRELLEETGVRTTFDSISFFRHWHGYRYGKSDIYFVATLVPMTDEIIMQEEEISECLWMPISDFLGNESVHDFNKTIVNASIKPYSMKQVTIDGYEPPDKYEFFGVSD